MEQGRPPGGGGRYGFGDGTSLAPSKRRGRSEPIPFRKSDPPLPAHLTIELALTEKSGRGRLPLPAELAGRYSGDGFDDPVAQREWSPRAVIEYGDVQTGAIAPRWMRNGTISWGNSIITLDIYERATLAIHFFLVRLVDSSTLPPVVPLGTATLDPLRDEREGDLGAWEDLPHGDAATMLRAAFRSTELKPLEDLDAWYIEKGVDSGDLVQVRIGDLMNHDWKGPHRVYGMTTTRASGFEPKSSVDRFVHPFIAPLGYVFRRPDTPDEFCLLSHMADGGNVFNHLQQERRFEVARIRLLGAELVSVLEYLHEQRVIAGLKPENLHLDPFGHVIICAPSLFGLSEKEKDDEYRLLPRSPEYPAPEVLSGNRATRAADWWTLGVFLHEFLTGLPPFYHKDREERERRVATQVLELEPLEEMPSAAKDLVARLLDKDPAKRLGANSAAEIKSHRFFDSVDWHKIQQKGATAFFPKDVNRLFQAGPQRADRTPPTRRVSRGVLYELRDLCPGLTTPSWWEVARVRDRRGDHDPRNPRPIPEDDGWDLVWQPASRELRFRNRWSGEDRPARLCKDRDGTKDDWLGSSSHEVDVNEEEGLVDQPSASQYRSAFRAALFLDYGKQVISQILERGDIDLDVAILHCYEHRQHANTYFLPEDIDFPLRLMPLEWAVKKDRADLVHLFLAAGADPNATRHRIVGPALVRAARAGNVRLAALLAPRSAPRERTRALCVAVDTGAAALAAALLAAGAPCDFPGVDPQPPGIPQCSGDRYVPDYADFAVGEYTRPLVRAVRLGRAGLVRTLLAHGADPDRGYHALLSEAGGPWDDAAPVPPPPAPRTLCGRPLQMAMELGHVGIVHLLLDAGADAALPQPAWSQPTEAPPLAPAHTCTLAPRSVYLEVTAALEAVIAERARGRKGEALGEEAPARVGVEEREGIR